MARQLDVIYEQGVLRPLEPLALAEHQRLSVTIDDKPSPSSWKSTEPVNERRAEMQWLAKHSGPYAGEWVALDGEQLIAHGKKLVDVRAAAKAAGIAEPLFASVPDDDLPFGGW
ncbi:MAG: antitoxin family protein [Bryobacteraceae bacterium]